MWRRPSLILYSPESLFSHMNQSEKSASNIFVLRSTSRNRIVLPHFCYNPATNNVSSEETGELVFVATRDSQDITIRIPTGRSSTSAVVCWPDASSPPEALYESHTMPRGVSSFEIRRIQGPTGLAFGFTATVQHLSYKSQTCTVARGQTIRPPS